MATNMTALLEGPAAVPPVGVIPQLDNPPSEWGTSHVFPAFSIVMSTILVFMRLYTTRFVTQRIGLPDWSILVGWGFFVGFATMCAMAVNIGPGVHMWDLRLKDLAPYLYYLRMGSILYGLTICPIKISILSQYIHVFMPHKQPRFLYWATIATMGSNVVAYVVLVIMQIWDCNPIRKSWDPFVVGGSCLDVNSLNIGATAVNVVSDTVIFILPQSVIWRLQMPTRQKIAISLMFLIAILAIASASIRLYYSVKLSTSTDTTWYTWNMGVWGLVEMDFGIIVACIPVSGALYRHIHQSTFFSNASRSLKGLASWKKMTDPNDESSSSYTLANRKDIDPYLQVVDSGNLPTTEGISWVKTYGVSGMDTLGTVNDSDLEANAGYTLPAGYHASVDAGRP